MTDFENRIADPVTIEPDYQHKQHVENALDRLNKGDVSAVFSKEVLNSLVFLEENDLQEFQRIIHELKKARVASEVRSRVKEIKKNKLISKNSVIVTFPIQKKLTQREKENPEQGFLVTYDQKADKSVLVAESDAALLLAEYLRDQLAYCEQARTWHFYNGTYWVPLDIETAANKIILKYMYAGATPVGFKNNYRNNIKALIADAGMLPLPGIQSEFLPFENGLLNIKTKQLIPVTPENAQPWFLPYSFNPSAKCPRILAWLKNAVDGDLETVQLLRAWLAAILHGRTDLQKFLHLLGRGGTGKGTFFRLAKALIGEQNTATTTLKTMEYDKFETANFYRKRLVVITDSDKYNGSVNILKAITGQDLLRLERKHQQAGSFTCEAVVMIASNEHLVSTDHTSGLDRRRCTVPFNKVFSEEEKLKWEKLGGEKILHDELPGLVNWLLELSQDEIARIIRKPSKRTQHADFNAMTASNPIAEWLVERCCPDVNAWTQIGVKKEGVSSEYENTKEWLYANYLQWCSHHNRVPLASRRFREILIDTSLTLGVDVLESRRKEGMGIAGIRLKKDWEDSFSKWAVSVGFDV